MMTTSPYRAFMEISAEATVPENGITSRTLHQDDQVKAVLFGFSAGQELSEHTAAVPAIMHFLRGEALVTVAGETLKAHEGTWIHMEPNLPHSIQAQGPVVMLLLMLKLPKAVAPLSAAGV